MNFFVTKKSKVSIWSRNKKKFFAHIPALKNKKLSLSFLLHTHTHTLSLSLSLSLSLTLSLSLSLFLQFGMTRQFFVKWTAIGLEL